MRRKLALLLSVIATTTLLFAGCKTETPTAEDLVNKSLAKM